MTQAVEQVDDELLNNEPEVVEEEDAVSEPDAAPPETTEEEADEIEVHIEGESPPPEEDEQVAPQWVRDVRKTNREQAKRIRELESQISAKPQAEPVEIGKEPEMEDFDYDTERYKIALRQYDARVAAAEEQKKKKREAEENAQKAWQVKLEDYGKQKSTLKVRDFEDAEAQAQEVLSVTQQGIILSGADAPAMLVYALGKNPKKAKELASISDPVKFAVAIGKLETQLKATPRKAAPLPESAVKGSGRAVNNQTLERLESEAMRSGDRSKVIAYKKQMKAKT